MIRYYIIKRKDNNYLHDLATDGIDKSSALSWFIKADKTSDNVLIRLDTTTDIHDKITKDGLGTPITTIIEDKIGEESFLAARPQDIDPSITTSLNTKITELGIDVKGDTFKEKIQSLLNSDRWL
jgi:hypothetical protein